MPPPRGRGHHQLRRGQSSVGAGALTVAAPIAADAAGALAVGAGDALGCRPCRKRERPADTETMATTRSPLADWMLSMWTWGELSACQLQQCAHAAYLEEHTRKQPDVPALASTGAWGSQPGNCHRDLGRKVFEHVQVPETFEVKVPAMLPKSDRSAPGEAVAGVLLPHDWVHRLSVHFEDAFQRVFGSDRVAEFWRNQDLMDPKLVHHPLLQVADFKRLFVPLWVHGDGAEHQNNDSLCIVSFCSVLGVRCTKDRKLYVTSWPKVCAASRRRGDGADTWRDVLWPVLAWSFNACFDGVHPSTDHNGVAWPAGSERAQLAGAPLCVGRLRFFIYGFQGDLEYMCNDLDMPHYQRDNFCWMCTCGRGRDNAWNDFRDGALWRRQCTTQAQACARPPSAHPFFSIRGVHSLMLMLDVMHVCDQNGVAAHCIGNVLFTIAYHQIAPPVHLAVGKLWVRIQQLYAEFGTPHRLHNLRLSMFSNERAPLQHYPCLTTAVKAADTRHLLRAMLKLCVEYDDGRQERVHRRLCLQHLVNFYGCMEGHGVHLPSSAHQKLEASVHQCLLHYSWLARHAMNNGLHLWSVVPMFHMLFHLAQQARYTNPRCSWTYMSEDFMGIIVKLAGSCTTAGALKVSLAVSQKYRLAMQLRLQRELQD